MDLSSAQRPPTDLNQSMAAPPPPGEGTNHQPPPHNTPALSDPLSPWERVAAQRPGEGSDHDQRPHAALPPCLRAPVPACLLLKAAHALLNPTVPLDQLPAHLNISDEDFVELLSSPALQELLANTAAIHSLRHQQFLEEATQQAVTKLKELVTQEDKVESRRAAQAITMTSTRATDRRFGRSVSPRPLRETAGATPTPRPLPEGGVGVGSASSHSATSPLCHSATSPHNFRLRPITPAFYIDKPQRNITPNQLILTALAHLKDNDFPSKDDGLRNLYAISTWAFVGLDNKTPEDFVKARRKSLEPLLDFHHAEAAPLNKHSNNTATQLIALTTRDGQTITATFRAAYHVAGPDPYCWQLDHITIHDTS